MLNIVILMTFNIYSGQSNKTKMTIKIKNKTNWQPHDQFYFVSKLEFNFEF